MGRHGDWNWLPVVTAPRSLDIVWCRFPHELDTIEPGPKHRPGLVRSVFLNPTHTRVKVEVCYGTSKLKTELYPNDLFIQNMERLNILGLTQATRFELDRVVVLPWCSEFFGPKDGAKTPILGRFGPEEVRKLDRCRRKRRA